MRQFQKLAHKGARMYSKLQQNTGRLFQKLGVKADIVNVAKSAAAATGGNLGISAGVLGLSGMARGIQSALNKRNYNALEAQPRQSGDTGPSEFA